MRTHESRSADARVYKLPSTPLFLSSLTHTPVLIYQNWNMGFKWPLPPPPKIQQKAEMRDRPSCIVFQETPGELVRASASPKIVNGLFHVRGRPLAAKTAPITRHGACRPGTWSLLRTLRIETDEPIPYVFGNTSEDTRKNESMRSCRHGLFGFLRLHYTTRSVQKPLLKCIW